MKKLIIFFLSLSFLFSHNSFSKNYPNMSGEILSEARLDRIISSKEASGVKKSNLLVNIESDISLNINRNWSVKTRWVTLPIEKRNYENPDIFRSILDSNRKVFNGDYGVHIEELKGDFKNEDMNFFFGKFNPKFGSAWNKKRRLGAVAYDFLQDYKLREKIGFGITAFLENSELSFSTFFNDNTNLSNSAFNKSGRNKRSDGTSGNTGAISSYSASLDGKNLFGIEDLFYNLGYRKLSTDNIKNRDDEDGIVAGIEYKIPLGMNTNLIPFFEISKINNAGGKAGRDSLYLTNVISLIYSSWNFNIANITRNISEVNNVNIKDRQMNYTIGYRFTNDVSLDVTRVNLRENGKKASMVDILLSYNYKF